MARPRPSAVVRLSEKTETSVTDASDVQHEERADDRRRRRRRAAAPAATRLPNTTTSRISVIGRAIISARPRSDSMVSPTWRNTSARPPTATVTVAFVARELGRQCLDDVVDVVVTAGDRHRARAPGVGPRLASGGALPRLQYDATVLPSRSASCSVIFAPSAATAASSTVPSLAVTRSTTLGSSEPNSRCRMAAARSDSRVGVGEAAGGQLVGDATRDHERRHHEHGRARPGWPCASGR